MLYHYTTAEACLKILEKRRLKGSLFDDLNDPFELLAVSIGNISSRTLLRSVKHELNKKYCLLCFSATWREPLLWAHYADKHKGVCLGFQVRDGLAQKVEYIADRIDHDFSRETIPLSERGQRIVKESLHTKHAGWAYEQEWRVFSGTKKLEDGKVYAEFDQDIVLREIILGERCRLRFPDLAKSLDPKGPRTTLRAARTAFTTFGVVKDPGKSERHIGRN